MLLEELMDKPSEHPPVHDQTFEGWPQQGPPQGYGSWQPNPASTGAPVRPYPHHHVGMAPQGYGLPQPRPAFQPSAATKTALHQIDSVSEGFKVLKQTIEDQARKIESLEASKKESEKAVEKLDRALSNLKDQVSKASQVASKQSLELQRVSDRCRALEDLNRAALDNQTKSLIKSLGLTEDTKPKEPEAKKPKEPEPEAKEPEKPPTPKRKPVPGSALKKKVCSPKKPKTEEDPLVAFCQKHKEALSFMQKNNPEDQSFKIGLLVDRNEYELKDKKLAAMSKDSFMIIKEEQTYNRLKALYLK